MGNETNRIRLAGGAQGFNWLPVFVAEEQGLFRQEGLDIEYLVMGSVDKATSAVRDGVADLAITPPEGAVTDHVAGGGLRIFAANSVRLPMSLVARPGISSLEQLAGAKIGTSSLTEGTALYVRAMLRPIGLSYPGHYEFVLAGVHTARWAALQNGTIDAAPQPAPWNFLAENAGYQRLGEVNDAIPEIVFAAVIGVGEWAGAHRESVTRFLFALERAHRIVNDPGQDANTLPIYQRITTPDDVELAARGLAYTRDMGMWPDRVQVENAPMTATINLMIEAGLIEKHQRAEARNTVDSTFAASRAS